MSGYNGKKYTLSRGKKHARKTKGKEKTKNEQVKNRRKTNKQIDPHTQTIDGKKEHCK